jgi:hypothetical protein
VDEKRKENGDTSKISYDVEVPDYKLVESALEKGGPQECTEQEKKAMHFYYHVAVRSVNGKAMGNKELLANKSLLKSMKRKDWYTMMACALTMMRYFSDTQNIVSRYRLVQQAQGAIATTEDIKVKRGKLLKKADFPDMLKYFWGRWQYFKDLITRQEEANTKKKEEKEEKLKSQEREIQEQAYGIAVFGVVNPKQRVQLMHLWDLETQTCGRKAMTDAERRGSVETSAVARNKVSTSAGVSGVNITDILAGASDDDDDDDDEGMPLWPDPTEV